MRDECKKNADALRLLTTFLDKIERQMPRDSAVPQTRDDAEKQLRSVKNVLEDMYDKQPTLDGLRNQVRPFLPFHYTHQVLSLQRSHVVSGGDDALTRFMGYYLSTLEIYRW